MEIKTKTFYVDTTYREFKPGEKVRFDHPNDKDEQGVFEVVDFIPPLCALDDDAFVGLFGRKHRVQSRLIVPA